MKKNPYQIIKHRHITEKATTLENLKTSESNRYVRAFKNPQYVFIVDPSANKTEIAHALEQIYKDEKIKVLSVNTINVKAKKRRVRGRAGEKSAFKKAIVTLEEGDKLDHLA